MNGVMKKEDKINHWSLFKIMFMSYVVTGIFTNLSNNVINVEFFSFMWTHENFFIISGLALIVVCLGTVLAGIMIALLLPAYVLSAVFLGKSKRINRFINKLSQSKPLIPSLIAILFVVVFTIVGYL
jgi:uncharacterized protein (DUF2062 family)